MQIENLNQVNTALIECGYQPLESIDQDTLECLNLENCKDGHDINQILTEYGYDEDHVQNDWANS